MTEEKSGGVLLVVGGGTMGAGIAQVALQLGAMVAISEADAAAAARARRNVAGGLRLAHKRSDDPQAAVEADLRRLTVAVGRGDLQPDLVVDALPEDAGLKAEILGPLSEQLPGTVLATNTSSLSVDGLAGSIRDPSRLIGMHFFNPVPRSELVELVVGRETAEATTRTAQGWVTLLGKESITVRDCPASPPADSVWPSDWRPSGWWLRAWLHPLTSNGAWCLGTGSRLARWS